MKNAEMLKYAGSNFYYLQLIQIYLGFLFNIYTKITNKNETFENTTTVE